jgi:signal transduction histidine kinase
MLIRNKLTLNFTILAMAIQITLSVIIFYFHSLVRHEEFDEQLTEKAMVAGRLLLSRRHLHDDFFRNMLRTDLLTIVDEQISIFDQRKNMVFTNRVLQDSAYFKTNISRISPKTSIELNSRGLETIGIAYIDRGQQFYIFTSGYDRLGLSKLSILQHILVIANLVGLALILLAGWYFSGRVLRPISLVVKEVEQITASDLNIRLNEGNRQDEIAQLAITFNRMLFRLEDAFASQRNFVSHASHELRTPLTNILGTLQTSLLYDSQTTDYQESMAVAVEELKKVITLTNSLLSLAKVIDKRVDFTSIQVDDSLLTAIGQIQAKYKDRQFLVNYLSEQNLEIGFTTRGNASLLTTAFANVLDNACKYSAQAVSVQLALTQGKIILTVSDHGIGVPEQDIANVIDPLYRGINTAGIPGYGIGLAVTSKIIAVHSGTFELESSQGEGTTATLTLPQIG